MDDLYLQLVLDGEISKYSYFIDKYKGMAFSIAFRIVDNKEDAEEVVQDSFLKAFRSLAKFRKGSKFSTWFYRIVVNTSLTKVRSSIPKAESLDDAGVSGDPPDEIESAYRNLEVSEQKKFVNEALDELNMEDRLVLTLYYLNENSIGEIEEITGIAGDNVKMKLHRARNRLHNILNRKLKSEINWVLG